MRKPFIAGNWKMHKTIESSESLVRGILDNTPADVYQRIDVAVCPPFTALYKISQIIETHPIFLGAQNAHFEREGAFTGEISPLMLKDIGVDWVIIGHSERREYFKEDDILISKKVRAIIDAGMKVIFCVGEKLEERERGEEKRVVQSQLQGGLKELPKEALSKIVLAYEPVWAIGTGKTASVEEAGSMHKFIREYIDKNYGDGENIRVLYGGSIKPQNISSLIAHPDIDGGLVGGASLNVDDFVSIILNSIKEIQINEE